MYEKNFSFILPKFHSFHTLLGEIKTYLKSPKDAIR